MAKPKGGTLTRLFAVSDAERKTFWQELEAKKRKPDQHAEAPPKAGTPETGAPASATPTATAIAPDPGIPLTGVPPTASPTTRPETAFAPSAGAPDAGTPVAGSAPIATAFVLSSPPAVRRKIREAVKVQDGHSLGEQAVYAALWAAGQPYGDDARRLTIGYRTLSDACGLTVNNCKANLQSLIKKLAIEPIAGHTSTYGTTYLIHSYPAILRRRRQAGMTHVIKTKGVVFVSSETGAPVSGTPAPGKGIPRTGTPHSRSGTPEPDTLGIPVSTTPIKNQELLEEIHPAEERPSSSFPLVVTAARQCGLALDDDAARRIVLRSQAFDEQASELEVAHFLRMKAAQLKNSRTVENPVGLLIKAVPQYFVPPASELASLRQRLASEAEREATQRRDQALETRRIAREILDDPGVSESEREWARAVLAESTGS